MKTGTLKIYRIFDMAHEIILEEAFEKLKNLGPTHKYALKKPSKDFFLGHPPIVLTLGLDQLNDVPLELTAKIWSYGAISFALTIDCPSGIDKPQILNWLKNWSNNEAVDDYCKSKVQELMSLLGKSLKKPGVWDQSEEYNIFVASTESSQKSFWLEDNFVYQLLSMEGEVPLSEAMISPIKECSLSYGPNDIVVIDWDNAFVFSSGDEEDICDVLELANVQLLELRYFDDLLDKKLSGLYRQVIERKPSIFNSTISLLSRDAGQIYIETSEVVERIENSLKVVGDIYFARLYRLGLKRLQVPQWQATVDQKLKNLLDISQMYMAELHNRRGHYMEIIIIILIAIEVIPFLYPQALKLIQLIANLMN